MIEEQQVVKESNLINEAVQTIPELDLKQEIEPQPEIEIQEPV